MSSQLTEVDQFTSAVTVPEPGEDVTAASVTTLAQALANRTLFLYNRDVTAQVTNWQYFTAPFTTNSLEDVGHLTDLNLYVFGRRSDNVGVSLGYPGAIINQTLATGGGKSGLLRVFMTSGPLLMFTIDSSTVVATDPDIWTYNGNVFTRQALSPFASTSQFRAGVYIASIDRWVLLGNEGATAAPAVYTSDNDGVTWNSQIIAAASAERIYDAAIATDETIVAVGTDTGGTNNVAWTSSDGATWADNPIVGANDVRFVARDEAAGVWMALSLNGANVTAYTSPDGVTWSAGGTLVGDTINTYGLANLGEGRFAALVEGDYGFEVHASVDGGTTWEGAATLSLAAGPDPVASGRPGLQVHGGRLFGLFTDGTDGTLALGFGM